MVDAVFIDIGLIIIVATITAFLARRFKQPLIPAYILAGLMIGPGLQFLLSFDYISNLLNLHPSFNVIQNEQLIRTLSEIGIAFLLFMVGLEIDLKKLRDVEKVSILGGSIQVLVMFAIAFVVAHLMFFSNMESVYLGFVVALSSTMVVVKILSDKKELETLHARIILGILLIQDIVAIFALIILNTLGEFSLFQVFTYLLAGIIMFLVAAFLGKVVFPRLFRYAASSNELFFLLSISICFFFSLVFMEIKFSIAIGAFVAGLTLGSLPYNLEIIGRVKSLRDFFAVLFFVSLGMQLPLPHVFEVLQPLLVFALLVVVIKPFVLLLVIGLIGYKRRTSFLTSVSLAQVSEFSLILIAQGMLLMQVGSRLFTITILLAIVTIAISSYFIKYEYKIYTWLAQDLVIFERISTHEEKLEYIPKKEKYEVVLIGHDRTGYSIFHKLMKMKQKFLVIDFNPEIIKKLIRQRIPCIYGDAGNIELLEKLDFKHMKFIISTVPDEATSRLIIKKARRINPDITLFVTAYQVDDALGLYDAGADYVILPHFLGGHHASVLLEEASRDITKLLKRKMHHIKELNNRKAIGHEHPKTHHHYTKHH